MKNTECVKTIKADKGEMIVDMCKMLDSCECSNMQCKSNNLNCRQKNKTR